MKALCPFHNEKTPSFFVFPESQSWRCFGGCADGGDMFSFIMKTEELNFGNALQYLADKAGIKLSTIESNIDYATFYKINDEASIFFYNQLISTNGTLALAYIKKRSVNQEITQQFKLGFSPKDGGSLKRHLMNLKFSENQLIEVGLLRRDNQGVTKDIFRNRMMFPIQDKQSRVVGFGGRTLDNSNPKYLNTAQSPIFDKSKNLYGFNHAYETIRKQKTVIIVEGYMDAITAHQYGCNNVVASMGTSLTISQVNLVRNMADNFVLALDQDTAGQNATLRSLESSWGVFNNKQSKKSSGRMEIKIASMPDGKDPDIVIKESPELWAEIINTPIPWSDFYFNQVAAKFDMTTNDGKAKGAQELIEFIEKIPNPYVNYQNRRKLSDLLGIPLSVLEANFGQRNRRYRQPITKSTIERANREPLEEYLLSLLLRLENVKGYMSEFRLEYLHKTENREIFTLWLKCPTIAYLRDMLEDSLQNYLDYLLNKDIPPLDIDSSNKALSDCVRRLELRHFRELKLQEQSRFSDKQAAQVINEEEILGPNISLKKVFHQQSPYQPKSECS